MKYQYHYVAEPFDVLYFRGNKAFDFGDWYSEGIFPPLPSTFQGFVRTSILLKHGLLRNGQVQNWGNAKKIIGDDLEFPLDLIGPYLTLQNGNNSFFFSTPKDIIKEKENDAFVARQNHLSKKQIQSDFGNLYFADEGRKPFYLSFEQELISLKELNTYRQSGKFCLKENDIVFNEEHYGIALDDNKKSKEHYFYLTPYKRLNKQVGIYFQLGSDENINDLSLQYSRLGSEGRGAKILKSTHPLSLKLSDEFYHNLAQEKRFKIIFLQPGILNDNINVLNNKKDLTVTISGLQLKLLFAVTDQKLKISGINFKQTSNNPEGHKNENGTNYKLKSMVNAVPAGSVFYFEILNGDDEENVAKVLSSFDGQKLPYRNYHKMGYNHIVLGKII